MEERVIIRNVSGRYPQRPAPLRSENIEVEFVELSRTYRIRIDDTENPEAWLEIVLEIEQ